jgi:hypothetical protein
MAPTITFFSLLSELLSEANDGLHEAMDASRDQPVAFVIPKIEMQLKCTILGGDGLGIVPSNATESNYYNDSGLSTINLTFKLKP